MSPNHQTSPVMRMNYDRLAWLARVARVPGVAEVLLKAIWECRETPPLTRPVGQALRTARALGWVPRGCCWRWSIPRQHDLLDVVAEGWDLLRHRIRESLRRAALLQLEARRPRTFGGLAGSIDRRTCRAGIKRYKDETELSILRGRLAGARWTALLVGRQQMRPSLDRPYCPGQVPETEGHILWDCPRWAEARNEWLP